MKFRLLSGVLTMLAIAACQASPNVLGGPAFTRPTDDAATIVTGQPLDLALPAPGAQTGLPAPLNQFVVSFIVLRTPTGDRRYTRSASFVLNARREFVHAATGYQLEVPLTIPDSASELNVRVDGLVWVKRLLITDYEERGTIYVARFHDPTALVPLGGGLFAAPPQAGAPVVGRPANDGQNELHQGILLP